MLARLHATGCLMLIEEYVERVSVNAQAPSADVLRINPLLHRAFYAIWSRSENKVLEHGCNLFFEEGGFKCGPTIEGLRDRVSLNVDGATTRPAYIGDFHVHPYLRKMGKNAKVGPSLTDIMEWLKDRPIRFPLSVNFVAGGRGMFVVILRDVTRPMPESLPEEIIECEPHRGSFEHINDTGNYSRWSIEISKAHSALGAGEIDRGTKLERELYDGIPGYATTFSGLTHRYNILVANHLRYEYYISEKWVDAGTCFLERASRPVY